MEVQLAGIRDRVNLQYSLLSFVGYVEMVPNSILEHLTRSVLLPTGCR